MYREVVIKKTRLLLFYMPRQKSMAFRFFLTLNQLYGSKSTAAGIVKHEMFQFLEKCTTFKIWQAEAGNVILGELLMGQDNKQLLKYLWRAQYINPASLLLMITLRKPIETLYRFKKCGPLPKTKITSREVTTPVLQRHRKVIDTVVNLQLASDR